MSKKIPKSDTTHFDREGFSGDIYVSSDQNQGFNALFVDVHGHHPLKRILEGNTRSYLVINGQGTFTVDATRHKVAKGDLFVINAGSTYEYEGSMELFEFNVSPNNSFGDENLEKKPLTPQPELVILTKYSFYCNICL